MVWLLRKCTKCEGYTLNEEKCPKCGGDVKIPHPSKFSMDDRYQHYKIRMLRMSKKDQSTTG